MRVSLRTINNVLVFYINCVLVICPTTGHKIQLTQGSGIRLDWELHIYQRMPSHISRYISYNLLYWNIEINPYFRWLSRHAWKGAISLHTSFFVVFIIVSRKKAIRKLSRKLRKLNGRNNFSSDRTTGQLLYSDK